MATFEIFDHDYHAMVLRLASFLANDSGALRLILLSEPKNGPLNFALDHEVYIKLSLFEIFDHDYHSMLLGIPCCLANGALRLLLLSEPKHGLLYSAEDYVMTNSSPGHSHFLILFIPGCPLSKTGHLFNFEIYYA